MIEAPVATGTTVSDYVARWLHGNGITTVFTLPGGMIAALLDAIHRHGGIDIVTMHHEQAVAFAADGVARFTGKPAVALATAGPGATNMLTAIGSAYLDSVPAVFITGQVQSYLLKGDRPVRQFGFQECDVVAMAEPVTKAAWRARTAVEVPALLDAAIALAAEGRPGPVLVELPADVQAMAVDADRPTAAVGSPAPPLTDPAAVEEVLDALASAQRPLVLVGGGVAAARAARRCREFLERLGVPVVASVMALDTLPAGHPLRLGMIGMYGNRWVNVAAAEADVVLVLGSRLDFGTIGADVTAWGRGRTVYQVDCDPGEMHRVRGSRPVVADLAAFLDAALAAASGRVFPARTEWATRVAALRAEWPDTAELAGAPGINPNALVRRLSEVSHAAAAFVVDAGQHLWWACQSVQPADGQRFMPALGMGPCGWAFPAAIGVAITERRPVVLVVGDGAFQFNIQELQTVVRNRLPLKIVVLDNGSHGSVRQLQESSFGGRYPSTVLGYDAPDFVRVAEAYGVAARAVAEPEEVHAALGWLWRDVAEPALLRVGIDTELNVYPNVPFGAPITAMEFRQRTEDR
ncbi:thiamine pyrophosphate-binding protein [Actinosynnema pretiosum subsp. pretiosum]|uniref:Thiamine pyrophosphate-binding protein n=1 Tax=Actinosynnema pretiosum subsp. pretiosum TaxID=103721 RepID=A0AA45L661_9PSEU|nr:Acetolactate synthase large subunit [Actinosynnema pretiosum subsp. pretiosum]QUF04086.1 thiamine pyrophosphate-binding protein [Actinosynnema pretiosum subsp. pretiosum]